MKKNTPLKLNISQKINKNSGFTLLELMVAMVIFSFMSVMAYSALANVFKSNEVITEQETKLKKLQRSMMFIERDLRQLVFRARSSGYGEEPTSPALASGLDTEGVIEFTRAGNSNPTGLSRSSLQRVRYTLEDKKFSRLSWNLVDHIDAEPVNMLLLDSVESLTFRFFADGDEKGWKENWASLTEMPTAVELTLEHENWGKIKRLFPVR